VFQLEVADTDCFCFVVFVQFNVRFNERNKRVKPERISSRVIRYSVSIELDGHPAAKKSFRDGLSLRDDGGRVCAYFARNLFLLISSDQPLR
jgi:hypothetical protein